MNILQVCLYYPPSTGGVENFVKELNNNIIFLKPSVHITVLCFRRSKNEKEDSFLNGVRVIRIDPFLVLSSQPIAFFLKRKIKNILNETTFDIINFHYPNPLMSNALLKAYSEINCKAELFVHWHGDIVGRKLLTFWYTNSTNRLLRACSHITSDTKNYALHSKLLVKFIDKVTTIPAIPDYSILNEAHKDLKIEKYIDKLADGRKIVFSFGRMVKWKGFQYLIESFKKLKQEEYILFLGGYGKYEKTLRKMAAGQENIFFIGKVNETTKYTFLKKADLFVFPSIGRQEAFGICLAEAMYCGTLCLTFDYEDLGAREIAIPDVSCISAKPRNIEDLARQIKRCCEMENTEKESITNTAKKIIGEKLSLDFYRQQIINTYFE